MSAVAYRVRRRLRRELGATILMALVVAVVSGAVLAVAAGARRTSTAPDRYVAAAGSRYDTIAALTGASMHRSTTDGTRFGFDFDVWVGAGQTSVADEVREGILADPDVGAVTLMAVGEVRVGSQNLDVVGVEQLLGALMPRMLAGRAPRRDDEIALGRVTARRLGVGVGDTLPVAGDAGSAELRVVGIAVVPGIAGNAGVGEDGVLTMAGMLRLLSTASAGNIMARLAPGASPDAALRLQQAFSGNAAGYGELPAVVEDLARVMFVPTALTLFVLALAVLIAVQALVTAIRNRRRDLAVLQAMGATRGWNRRAAAAQAVAFVGLPGVVALPVGLAAGRAVFRAIADAIGIVNTPSYPVTTLASGGVLLIVALAVLAVVLVRGVPRAAAAWLRHG